MPHELKGEVIVVFVRLRPGELDDPELRASVSAKVVEYLGKALKPEAVHVVGDLPRTRSRQDHAPRRPRGLPGRRSGRPLRARNPLAVESISGPALKGRR